MSYRMSGAGNSGNSRNAAGNRQESAVGKAIGYIQNTRALPAYTVSVFHPHLNPTDLDPGIAAANGDLIYRFMNAFLAADWEALVEDFKMNMNFMKMHPLLFPDGFDPLLNENKRTRIANFFNRPEAKEWLARQFYLLTSFTGPLHYGMASLYDDIPHMLRWLLLNQQHPAFPTPSPLYVNLKIGGKRKSKKRSLSRRRRRTYRSRR